MASSSLTVRLRIDGLRETMRAFRELPKEANNSLRDRTLELSERLAGRVRTAATGDSGQSALIAPTVKAKRDRVPVIQAGGTKKVGRNRVPAFKVLFGAEFGATRLKQYRPHVGQGSYWFFRTVEENEAEIADAWRKVADDIIREWAD